VCRLFVHSLPLWSLGGFFFLGSQALASCFFPFPRALFLFFSTLLTCRSSVVILSAYLFSVPLPSMVSLWWHSFEDRGSPSLIARCPFFGRLQRGGPPPHRLTQLFVHQVVTSGLLRFRSFPLHDRWRDRAGLSDFPSTPCCLLPNRLPVSPVRSLDSSGFLPPFQGGTFIVNGCAGRSVY